MIDFEGIAAAMRDAATRGGDVVELADVQQTSRGLVRLTARHRDGRNLQLVVPNDALTYDSMVAVATTAFNAQHVQQPPQ